jgi:hypothetical protein
MSEIPAPNDPADELLEHLPPSRRTFVKRVAIGAAFATPVVSSFSMSGVNSVFAQVGGSQNQPPLPPEPL